MLTSLLPAPKEISKARLLLTAVRSSELLGEGAMEHVTEVPTHPAAGRPGISSQWLVRSS